ncbi:hypothetical protein ACFLIM_41525 [Nonomuraea sp. M3C6]|uniref:Uncharacterized protein n=1 Tax=Nonomuraea marmarensis TaxID=3351344 RepID=A0ABW7AQJ7_9ACTN
MTAEQPPPYEHHRYRSPQREQQAARTRASVLTAAAQLLSDAGGRQRARVMSPRRPA